MYRVCRDHVELAIEMFVDEYERAPDVMDLEAEATVAGAETSEATAGTAEVAGATPVETVEVAKATGAVTAAETAGVAGTLEATVGAEAAQEAGTTATAALADRRPGSLAGREALPGLSRAEGLPAAPGSEAAASRCLLCEQPARYLIARGEPSDV